MQYRKLFAAAAIASAALFAADAPYIGTWKMNPSKSNLAGTTMTYRQLPSGEWQSTSNGNSYTFRLDGKDYPDGLGDTAAWKQLNANMWQSTWKVNGATLSTDTLHAGVDGLLMIESKGTRPDGQAMDDRTILQRVSGGPGLAGKWKTKAVEMSSPDIIELTATGNDGLTFKEPALNLTCESKLDRKNHPCGGRALGSWSVATVKTGPGSFVATIKKDGKPIYRYSYTPSADGKTLVATGGAANTSEKVRIVYDRQ
jgi:hypothetical protein